MKKSVWGFLALAIVLVVSAAFAFPPKGYWESRAHGTAWGTKGWWGQVPDGGACCHLPFEREKAKKLLELKEKFLKETAPLREELLQKRIELKRALLDERYEDAERLKRELFKIREKMFEKRLQLEREIRQTIGR